MGLDLIKEELESIQMGLWVARSGMLFNIISDGSKLQAKLFCILSLQNVASLMGAQFDAS